MNPKLEKLIIVLVFLAAYYGILYHPDLPVFINEFNTVDGSIFAARLVDVCTSLIIFFTASFYLIPAVLERRRFVPFFLFSLGLIVTVSLLEFQLDQVILRLFNLPMGPNEISDKMLTFYRRKAYDFPILPVNLLIFTLGTLYGLSRDWIRKYRREGKLAQEKMRADIDFLRSQINPHFFFNTLNNIYAITQRNEDDEAGQAIMKLSGLMRYMTYDSNVAKIGLAQEIEHIENYLEVARLRFSAGDKVDIKLTKSGDLRNYKIAPLLLIPFVENGFKHGFGSNGEGYLHLCIHLNGDELMFTSENQVINKQESIQKHSGIGMDNVKKRLALLYPAKHQLSIDETAEKYSAELRLVLS